MSRKKEKSQRSIQTKRLESGNWIWHHFNNNQVWMIFVLSSIVYSFLLVVPFVQMAIQGNLDVFQIMIGLTLVFVIGPAIFAISPRFYYLFKKN